MFSGVNDYYKKILYNQIRFINLKANNFFLNFYEPQKI